MLEVDDVVFRFDDLLMRFRLRVAAGDWLALIGPSGAGKSTLLNLIGGFNRPESGRIVIDGVDVTAMPPAARPVTTLFQDNNLFTHLSAADNVALALHPGLRLDRDGWQRVEAALAQVGLAGLGQRLPGQLSGGERQRVALGRSLLRARPLLLLDEPFAALGPAQRRDMLALVDRLRRAMGFTVVMVTHQTDDVCRGSNRAAFVHAGSIIAVDDSTALLARRNLPELTDYLGD